MLMMQLTSTIRCPKCGGRTTETMATDACQFFYDCTHCGAVLRPLPGDCCVFCSYADVPCPPVQEAREAGGNEGCCSPV
jgi:DNA-directed RNA polymerase subunit RPC12/RpoP